MSPTDTDDGIDKQDYGPTRNFYDQVYYQTHSVNEEVPRHLRRLALRLQPWARKRLLDVACGAGLWLRAVTELGAAPVGVDISEVAIRVCRKTVPQADLHCGPAENLPFLARQFDFVCCLGALEHFLDPERALAEMIRVAKRDAQFLLLVPNAGFLPLRLGLYRGTDQWDMREDVRSLAEWERLFQSAGLRVVKRWRDLHVLSGSWITLGPRVLWPIRLAQALLLCVWPVSWQYQVYYLCRLQ